MPRMADVLVDQLLAAGINTAFGVPGESYLPILDAIALRPDRFRYITCRHESGAAMAAEAWGKLTGRPGICMVTRGPGASNACAGIHVARQDATPLIMFIGQIETGFRHREAFQEVDFETMFAPLAKWAAEIREPDRAAEYVSRAISCATSGRPGPVVLSLPEDLLDRDIPAASGAPHVAARRTVPHPDDIDAVVGMLSEAERPLILAGGGGWTRDASRALKSFSENWAVPVMASWRRQDVLENSHAHYAGHVGIGPDRIVADAVRSSDLLLVFGDTPGEATTSGYGLIRIPYPDSRLVHVHPDPDELGKVYKPSVGIAASYAEALNALAARAPKEGRNPGAWLTKLRKGYEHYSIPTADQVELEPAFVIRHISDALPANAIVANGAGNYARWMQRFFRYRGFGSQLSPTSGTMGYGLPAAIAASILNPDVPVVCLAGDGCFMMTSQELATAARYRLNLKVLIFNNSRYGTIRMHQERTYPGREAATELTNPDFVAFARSFGAWAKRVESTDAFPDTFQELLRQPGLGVIELAVDPNLLQPGMKLEVA